MPQDFPSFIENQNKDSSLQVDEETGLEKEAEEQTEDCDDITRPFDPEKIKVNKVTQTISLIVSRIDHGEIDLEPDFQRRARIWDLQRKSRLIESLLLRIPLPAFYVAADANENWAVVDGLQRLTTIFDFLKGDFKLKGLEYLKKYNNLKFDGLPRQMLRRIEETELNINVIDAGTPEEVMFNIFKRINTGGLSLNGQEIRNALNKGPVRSFLKALVESEAFKLATYDSIKDERMAARECALRFMAFHLTSWREYDTNDLDGLLSATMRKLNAMPEMQRIELYNTFQGTMHLAHQLFDDNAFRKLYSHPHQKKPISKPLFETWSVNLAALNEQEKNQLLNNKQILQDTFIALMDNNREFGDSITSSTGTPQRVRERFGAIEKLIFEVLYA